MDRTSVGGSIVLGDQEALGTIKKQVLVTYFTSRATSPQSLVLCPSMSSLGKLILLLMLDSAPSEDPALGRD